MPQTPINRRIDRRTALRLAGAALIADRVPMLRERLHRGDRDA